VVAWSGDSFLPQGAGAKMTLEFWVKTTAVNGVFAEDWDIADNNAKAWDLFIGLGGDLRVRLVDQNGAGVYDCTGTNQVNDGVWHHIAMVYSDSANVIRTYVDGAVDCNASTTYTLGPKTASYFHVGAKKNGAVYQTFLNGQIDELAIYSTALSATTIADHFNSGTFPAGTYYIGAIADVSNIAPIEWTNAVGVTVSGNSLTKNTSTNGWGDSGASSVRTIAGDGFVEFTAQETTTGRMLGLSTTDADQSYTSINYALALGGDALVRVYENGTLRGTFGTYTTGDVFHVERVGTTVYYKQNSTTFYTSTVASSGDVIADAAFYHIGSTITNAVICTATPCTYGQVAELNENNNSAVQAVAGTPDSVSVSVVTTTSASDSSSSGGGGALGLLWLMILVLFAGWRFRLLHDGKIMAPNCLQQSAMSSAAPLAVSTIPLPLSSAAPP